MIKKKSLYQGLDQYKALIQDTSLDSPNYFRLKDIPEVLTGGKNLIKIRLNNNFLKIGSDVRVEVLDYNNRPIYNEFTKYIDKDGESHVIAIYIYDDTPPGPATIYITGVAEYYQNGERISSEYTNSYNVIWNKTLLIAPDKRNSTEILFDPIKIPSASVQEVISPYLQRTFPTGTENVTFNTGQVKYQLLQGNPTIFLEGAQFSSSMAGGMLTVTSPTNPQPTPLQGSINSTTYTTKIKKVLNTNNLLLDTSYTVDLNNSSVKRHTYSEFGLSNYTITYKDVPTYIPTQNSMSYAQITLSDIEPITGDIYRIKTFRKSPGVVSTWQLVDDNILESSEMLVDNTSLNINKRTGVFEDVNIVNEYWNIDNTDNSISPTPSRSFVTTPLNNSLKVNTTQIPNNQTVRLFSTQSFNFFTKGDYILQFDAYAQQINATSKVNVYLSGSGFDYNGVEKIKGKKIGFLNPSTSTTRYDDYKIEFEADNDGTGTVIFEIEKGLWYFSDISLKSGQETGFNPNSTTMVIPVETQMLNDKLDFKFEYFDYENNQASHVTYLTDQLFEGGNTYIDGANNLLTGSMYIGREFGKGLEQSGRSSGMIRSTGYLGFTSASRGTGPAGWMMWSGSAIKDINPSGNPIDSAKPYYDGVGIELHGGQDIGGSPYTASGVMQFRSDTRQLFLKGTVRTRFDDGRTMNPPIPFPERFVLDDTSNTFKFFLTGSDWTTLQPSEPILEIGSEFEVRAGGNMNFVTMSGLDIVHPTKYWQSPYINIGTGKIVTGIVIRDEYQAAGSTLASNGKQSRNTVIGPGTTEVVGYNSTGSTAKTILNRVNDTIYQSAVNDSYGDTYFQQDRRVLVCAGEASSATNLVATASALVVEVGASAKHSVRGIESHVGKPSPGVYESGGQPANQASTDFICYFANIGGYPGDGNAAYPAGNRYTFQGHNGEMLNSATYAKSVSGRTMIVNSAGVFGNATSDRKFKTNIVTIDNSLDKVKSLRGVYFNWKDTTNMSDRREIGLIAQEVEKVVPELVFPPDEHADHYSVNYKQMTGLLVESIKEQQQIIEDLQSRIEQLEQKSKS